MNMQSETIGQLADALSKAQGEMENAAKDKNNPFFKSTYADLTSIWDACRIPLSKNKLCVVQSLGSLDSGKIVLTTTLMHSSGEWIASEAPVNPTKPDPQALGSTITYMRRFSLAALVGIAPAETDDDGNEASGRPVFKAPAKPQESKVVQSSVKAMQEPQKSIVANSQPSEVTHAHVDLKKIEGQRISNLRTQLKMSAEELCKEFDIEHFGKLSLDEMKQITEALEEKLKPPKEKEQWEKETERSML